MRGRKPIPMADRFWDKVDKTGDCWNWTGHKMKSGYGQIGLEGAAVLAHRVSYEASNGPIPEGLVIDHICHNPPCVNPAHLHAVSPRQNSENRNLASASASGIRGVFWHKGARKWVVRARKDGKLHYAGLHSSLQEAQAAAVALRNSLYTNNLADRMVP